MATEQLSDYQDILSHARRLAVNPSGFVFDPVVGRSFTLNETGLFILGQLQNAESLAQVQQQIESNYIVEPHQAECDLLVFIRQLKKILS